MVTDSINTTDQEKPPCLHPFNISGITSTLIIIHVLFILFYNHMLFTFIYIFTVAAITTFAKSPDVNIHTTHIA